MSKQDKKPCNPCSVKGYVLVERTELENLIEARVERDLIFDVATNNIASYAVGDLIKAMCRIHGLKVEE